MELQLKRKEEKELRSTEIRHRSQITTLESDLVLIETRLENLKETHATLKRDYQAQLVETEKLRARILESKEVSNCVLVDSNVTDLFVGVSSQG